MRRILLLALGLGLLSYAFGCKPPEPVVVYKEIKVPVPVPCPPPSLPARPMLLTPSLPLTATPEEQAKALVADYAALLGYCRRLEESLRPYESDPAQ